MDLLAGTSNQIIHDQIADVFRTYHDVIAKGHFQALQNSAVSPMHSTNFEIFSSNAENIHKTPSMPSNQQRCVTIRNLRVMNMYRTITAIKKTTQVHAKTGTTSFAPVVSKCSSSNETVILTRNNLNTVTLIILKGENNPEELLAARDFQIVQAPMTSNVVRRYFHI